MLVWPTVHLPAAVLAGHWAYQLKRQYYSLVQLAAFEKLPKIGFKLSRILEPYFHHLFAHFYSL